MTELINGLYAAEVPEGANNIQCKNRVIYAGARQEWKTYKIDFEPEIIGLFNSLSEERARELVELETVIMSGGGSIPLYKCHTEMCTAFNNAQSSLRSLLESKGLTPDSKNYLLIRKVDK